MCVVTDPKETNGRMRFLYLLTYKYKKQLRKLGFTFWNIGGIMVLGESQFWEKRWNQPRITRRLGKGTWKKNINSSD